MLLTMVVFSGLTSARIRNLNCYSFSRLCKSLNYSEHFGVTKGCLTLSYVKLQPDKIPIAIVHPYPAQKSALCAQE